MINEFKGKYLFLSNFYPSDFYIKKRKYPTVEHYYQSMKTTNFELQEKIRLLKTPKLAKKYGSKVKLRDDWNNSKLLIMYKGVYQKFKENMDIRFKLLDTYPMQLIEGNTWGDRYWGFCRGSGENKLGKILMKIRYEFANQDVPF